MSDHLPFRLENKFNDAVVFQSCAAVGLIVCDNQAKHSLDRDGPKGYVGGFYSPEEARQIAAKLNEMADRAEADRAATPQKIAELEKIFGPMPTDMRTEISNDR